MDHPDGSTVQLTYGLDGQRASKTVTSAGPTPTTITTHYVYMQGQLAYETDGAGAMLAAFAYDEAGAPASVAVGSDPSSAPRYYYVYNGHGDVVALVAADGSVVASYSCDPFGGQFSANESFANGWSNPYRYAGREGLRLYDPETALYLAGGRAYDPVLGRALSNAGTGTDSAGYVADGNNPLTIGNAGGQASMGGMQADAGGSSRSPYGVCSFDCGRGGGNRQIVLNGATWRERDAERPTVGGRLAFARAFGRQYSSHGGDWNRAEEGFMKFLLASGADRMANSPYWGGVDGLLIDTMFDAAWRVQHGLGYPPQRPVRWWMHYARHPGNYWFWLAHNDSINEDTFDAWSSGQRWYDSENYREAAFINDAVLVLYVTGYVEIGAPAAAVTPFTGTALKLIAILIVTQAGSNSAVVEWLTGQHYPKRYPAESTWFKTKIGRAYSIAGCVKRVFPDARCYLR